LSGLPYGIFFFGMSFFIFAEAFSGTILFNSILDFVSTLSESPINLLFSGLFGSGLLVNIFNDIPASALIAEILSDVSIDNYALRVVFYQSILSGLNIGKYVTQIGALAGLLWFNVIEVENKKNKLKNPEFSNKISLPNRSDLIKFGIINFVINGIMLFIFFIFEFAIISFVINNF
jgi:Na+/H+ antiporter NhaD/arsenite permease-like protein